jgi:hypothetical protein
MHYDPHSLIYLHMRLSITFKPARSLALDDNYFLFVLCFIIMGPLREREMPFALENCIIRVGEPTEC